MLHRWHECCEGLDEDVLLHPVLQAYGTATYHLSTWKQVPRGTEGAVSLEGSLAGLIAAASFALCSSTMHQVGRHKRN